VKCDTLHRNTVKARPHLFPKQDNLYPETETLYPETGYFVSVLGNKIPFRDIKFPFQDTIYPVSETNVDRPLLVNKSDSFVPVCTVGLFCGVITS